MKIGVFDSGVGGLSVARAIEKALPKAEVIFVNDSQHMPYGTKSPGELYGFVEPIFQNLVDKGCEVIVIACNTVSTTLAGRLRERFKVPLIAMEPMVKPAAARTKTGVIAVCATPTTLASARYAELKKLYAPDITVLEPNCSTWSYMIEHDAVDQSLVEQEITAVIDQKADVIVLGCTHYHWIEKEIQAIAADKAIVLQPEQAIVQQLKRVLALPV